MKLYTGAFIGVLGLAMFVFFADELWKLLETENERVSRLAVEEASAACLRDTSVQRKTSIESAVSTQLDAAIDASGSINSEKIKQSVNVGLEGGDLVDERSRVRECMVARIDKYYERNGLLEPKKDIRKGPEPADEEEQPVSDDGSAPAQTGSDDVPNAGGDKTGVTKTQPVGQLIDDQDAEKEGVTGWLYYEEKDGASTPDSPYNFMFNASKPHPPFAEVKKNMCLKSAGFGKLRNRGTGTAEIVENIGENRCLRVLLKANYRDAVKVSKASSGGWLIAQIVQCRQTDRLCDKD